MLKIKLEEGEKLPVIYFSQQAVVDEVCPECDNDIRIFFHKGFFGDNDKWFFGECDNCGNKILLTPKECDLLQPSSKLFKIYYGKDIFAEGKENKKKMEWEKEKRKEELDLKYDKKFSKPWERKFVKDIVLKEKGGLLNGR